MNEGLIPKGEINEQHQEKPRVNLKDSRASRQRKGDRPLEAGLPHNECPDRESNRNFNGAVIMTMGKKGLVLDFEGPLASHLSNPLLLGDKNVIKAETLLARANYNIDKMPDGFLTRQDVQALKDLQQAAGLKPSGILDQETMNSLILITRAGLNRQEIEAIGRQVGSYKDGGTGTNTDATTKKPETAQEKTRLEQLKKFEKLTDWLYKDSTGNVTVGYGHNVDAVSLNDFKKLPFKINGRMATAEEKMEAYYTIKNAPTNYKAEWYAHLTKIRLDKADIDVLFKKDVTEKEVCLRRKFDNKYNVKYDQLPNSVQTVLLDMVFNLGEVGLFGDGTTKNHGFPKFLASIEKAYHKKDLSFYKEASKQSHRIDIGEDRNKWAEELLKAVAEGKN